MYWGPQSGSVTTTPDLFLEEAIAAARRGVAVRILLSDSYLDPTDPRDNTHTVKYVNEIARKERLNMQARLFRSDLAALDKIHNKGIIVDGTKVLVSSINWSLNSPLNNREVGLILDHPTIGSYYTDLLMSATIDTRPGAACIFVSRPVSLSFAEGEIQVARLNCKLRRGRGLIDDAPGDPELPGGA